ncbi:hypothetical protein, partial [Methylobacterium frigidaeris]
ARTGAGADAPVAFASMRRREGISGFVKTLPDYRLEAKKAEALQPRTARDIAAGCGATVFDSIAIGDLTAAVKALTAAIAAGTASDQARLAHEAEVVNARIADALEQLAEQSHRQQRGGARIADLEPSHRQPVSPAYLQGPETPPSAPPAAAERGFSNGPI